MKIEIKTIANGYLIAYKLNNNYSILDDDWNYLKSKEEMQEFINNKIDYFFRIKESF